MCNISDEGLETRFIVTKVPAGTSEAYVVSFSSEKYQDGMAQYPVLASEGWQKCTKKTANKGKNASRKKEEEF
jgi:hypothetical protein